MTLTDSQNSVAAALCARDVEADHVDEHRPREQKGDASLEPVELDFDSLRCWIDVISSNCRNRDDLSTLRVRGRLDADAVPPGGRIVP